MQLNACLRKLFRTGGHPVLIHHPGGRLKFAIKRSLISVAALLLIVTAAGCRKESGPIASQPAQKQAMLAAKEALFNRLSGRLMEAMGGQGPAAAISVCQQEAPQIADEVSTEHNLRIGRTGVRLRNQNNEPPVWAKSLTDNETDTPQFVVLDNEDAAALLPIKLQAHCSMCHGPKEQIAPVIQDQLAKLYPADEATGFNEGDLRGWFWIEMPGG